MAARYGQVEGKAEVIIGKQRHGPTGTVKLNFEGQFTRFSDAVDESHLPYRMPSWRTVDRLAGATVEPASRAA